MLASRTPWTCATTRSESVIPRNACSRLANVPRRYLPSMLVGTSGRFLTVAVFAKKDHKESHDSLDRHTSGAELQAYIDRERFLLSELAAARAQVDKLLDQQQLLLSMVARLTGLGQGEAPGQQMLGALGGSVGASAAPPAAPPQRPPTASRSSNLPAASSAAPPPARKPSGSSSPGSTSPDVPALTSLAELFKSAAAAAPHPASAAAAASIAAAVAAVDSGDILAINRFEIGAPAQQQPQQPPAPGAGGFSLPQPSLIFDTLGGSTLGGISAADAVAAAWPSESSASSSLEVGDQGEAAADPLPVEVAKAAPTEPPPDLVQGDDDIYWLSRLHAALEQRGFFPGDDDMENWYFGETTMAAVLTFQASERLPETGVVDRPTWTALLGAEVAEELYGRAKAEPSGSLAAAAVNPSASSSSSSASSSSASASTSTSSFASDLVDLSKWPVLMEGDGGRAVHALQVALSNSGFHCGEDDMRWWQFGDATLTALKYFQSCSSIPESGVCDERSWRALLGPGAQPADLLAVRLRVANSDDEDGYEEDMDGVSQGRVWLLGEQRWERRA